MIATPCGADLYIRSDSHLWEKQRRGEQAFAAFRLDSNDQREELLLHLWEFGPLNERVGICNKHSGSVFVRQIRAVQPVTGNDVLWVIGWDVAGDRGSRAPEGDTKKLYEARKRAAKLAERELDLLRGIVAAILRGDAVDVQGLRDGYAKIFGDVAYAPIGANSSISAQINGVG